MTLPPLLRALRPRQWVKNVLVAAGPLAAGTLLRPPVLAGTVLAFVAFCLCASGVYLVNDVVDREEDRRHPSKRRRPIASGAVRVPVALALGVTLLVGVPLVLALAGRVQLGAVLGMYAALQISYCLGLKNQAVIDIALVSSGFLLRAVAGGAATGIVLSPHFLLVAAFGSLFMVAGKRYSEVNLVGERVTATRRSLQAYSASYLRFVWGMAGAVTLVFYSQWAFGLTRKVEGLPQLSMVFFTVAMLRYAVDIDRGTAGEPEAIVLGDRVLQLIGAAWLGIFLASATVG